jgi:hypothetical protein
VTDPDRCLSPRELARRWRCRPGKVRGMISRGELAAFVLNGRPRVSPEEIQRMERGPLAVRPVKRRRREPVPAEVIALLET